MEVGGDCVEVCGDCVEVCNSRYQLQTNFVTYYGVINAIPKEYKIALKGNDAQEV